MATTREKRKKRQRASASKRAEKRAAGDRSTIRKPDGISFYKKKEGIRKLNIVEYKVGKGNPFADEGRFHYERTFYVHYIPVPGGKAGRICARKTAGKKCYVCDHISKLQQDEDADEKLIRDLLPRERQIFLVNDPKDDENPLQIYEDAYGNFGERLDKEITAEKEDNPDVEAFAAPGEEGKTLKVGFTEESFAGNKYLAADTIKFLPRNEDADSDIWEHDHCLDAMIVIPDYDTLKKEFLGEDDEDEDEDKPKKKKGKEEDDEEDEDEDEEDGDSKEDTEEDNDEDDEEADEEDDEVKPKKKKASASSKSKSEDEDDEDEEDDADEEDEDDKPPFPFKKGDKVSFVYKGKKLVGVIAKIDVENELVRIKHKDRDQLYNIDIADDNLKKLKAKKKEAEEEEDDEEDEKPAKKTSKKKSKDEDEDEDDDIPFDDDDEEEEEEDD